MSGKVQQGGVDYNITGGKVKQGGTDYNIISGKVKQGETNYNINFSKYKANFEDNTWEDIIEACQTKQVPSTWRIGDQKSITFNNGMEYYIDIIDIKHDNYADGTGKAPLTFQFHELWEHGDFGSYSGWLLMNDGDMYKNSWRECIFRKLIQQQPKELFSIPDILVDNVKAVTKITAKGGWEIPSSADNTNTDGEYFEETEDTFFFLSEREIFGTSLHSYARDENTKGEGSQYLYYQLDTDFRIKKYQDTSYRWWTRSPSSSNISSDGYNFVVTQFCMVSNAGNTTTTNANYYGGIAPAFCF